MNAHILFADSASIVNNLPHLLYFLPETFDNKLQNFVTPKSKQAVLEMCFKKQQQ